MSKPKTNLEPLVETKKTSTSLSPKTSPKQAHHHSDNSKHHCEEVDHQMIKDLKKELEHDDLLLQKLEGAMKVLKEERDEWQKRALNAEKENENVKQQAKDWVEKKRQDYANQAKQYVSNIEKEKIEFEVKYRKYKNLAKKETSKNQELSRISASPIKDENEKLKQQMEINLMKSKKEIQDLKDQLNLLESMNSFHIDIFMKIELSFETDQIVQMLYGKDLSVEKILSPVISSQSFSNSSQNSSQNSQNSQNLNSVAHSGIMVKRGSNYKTWKERFFVLKDNFLFYYETSKSNNPLGIVHLCNHYTQKVDKHETDHENSFKIIVKDHTLTREHFYYTRDAPSMEMWMTKIENCSPWWEAKTRTAK